MINAMEDVPCMIKFPSAATHDHIFLKDLELKKGSYVVFDKGYVDYQQYHEWTLNDFYFVSRQKDNARYTSLEEFDIPDKINDGVLKDEKIELLVSLIIKLIMIVIQRKAQRKWAYSNMMYVIRHHLMTYIDLFKFLKNPEDK